MPSLTPYDLDFPQNGGSIRPPTYANGHISATGDPIHFMFCSRVGFFGDGGSDGAIFDSNNFNAAILDNFEWPHLRNSSRSTYSAHRAVIFAIAQLSCISSRATGFTMNREIITERPSARRENGRSNDKALHTNNEINYI